MVASGFMIIVRGNRPEINRLSCSGPLVIILEIILPIHIVRPRSLRPLSLIHSLIAHLLTPFPHRTSIIPLTAWMWEGTQMSSPTSRTFIMNSKSCSGCLSLSKWTRQWTWRRNSHIYARTIYCTEITPNGITQPFTEGDQNWNSS